MAVGLTAGWSDGSALMANRCINVIPRHEPYSVITYSEYSTLTRTYDNTHDIPIYVDNGTTLNIMPTHFYEKAYYLHHLPKEDETI